MYISMYMYIYIYNIIHIFIYMIALFNIAGDRVVCSCLLMGGRGYVQAPGYQSFATHVSARGEPRP